MDIIKTTKLTKYYGKARGIIDLDLTVTHGEFFGFIGPNGAGKSTTIRTLLGLIAPTSGSAMIFGKDVMKEKESILQNIGYLPSEASFYQGMKVKDILKLSADLRKRIVRQKQNCFVSVYSLIQPERSMICPSATERRLPLSALYNINRNYWCWTNRQADWIR